MSELLELPSQSQEPTPRAEPAPASHARSNSPSLAAKWNSLCTGELVSKVALTPDGVIVVGRPFRTDDDVLFFLNLLEDHGFEVHSREVEADEIRPLLAAAGAPMRLEAASQSQRQSVVMSMIKDALRDDASDLQLRNGPDATKVFWRVDGELSWKRDLSPEEGDALTRVMYDSMADNVTDHYHDRVPQDARLARRFMRELGLSNARLSTRPAEYGNIVALRFGRIANLAENYPDSGYHESQVPLLEQMAFSKGFVLLSGPMGSGKSQSLALMMKRLLKVFKDRIHVMTIENPVENEVDGVNHTMLTGDLSTPAGVSAAWSSAIANIMRMDVNYLALGEVRDAMAAASAMLLVLTGHGLLGTIHADEIFGILDRLAKWGIEEIDLCNPDRFTGLINQGLAPMLCPDCKRPFSQHYRELDNALVDKVNKYCTPESVFIRGNDPDCPTCGGKGTKGRKLVAEVCQTNQALLDVYRTKGARATRQYWVREMGGLTKGAHVRMRVNAGEVDPFHGYAIIPFERDDWLLRD